MDYNTGIREKLRELSEDTYREFHSSLTPGSGKMYGVRLPFLRKMARELAAGDWRGYLAGASGDSYEEVMLQGLTIAYVKAPFAEIEESIREFVPIISNWAVCDSFCNTLKIARKEPEPMWNLLETFRQSGLEFELRFVIVMYLNHFLVPAYLPRVLGHLTAVRHEGYYVKMAVAWTLAESYLKDPEGVRNILRERKLDSFTHNKAIQKMRESYRISREEKEELKKLKVQTNTINN